MSVPRYLILVLTLGAVYEIADCGRYARAPPKCPKLTGFNGRIKYRRRGTRAVFKCAKDETRYGPRFITCQRGGTWDGEIPVCIKSGCVPVDISQSQYLDMTEEYGGALLKFSCQSSYQLRGATESYCNGRIWSNPLPRCIATADLTECDFEQDTCGWTQDDTDQGEWVRHAGATPTGNTGPKFDHTHMDQATGHYMFFEASNPTTNGDQARLISPEYTADMSPMCFDFWYHILGPDDKGHVGSLEVFIRGRSQFLDDLQPVFYKEGNQGDVWTRGEIVVDEMTEPYQIVIGATRKLSYISDIAVDDLRLFNCTADTTTSTTTALPTTAIPTTEKTTAPPTTTIGSITITSKPRTSATAAATTAAATTKSIATTRVQTRHSTQLPITTAVTSVKKANTTTKQTSTQPSKSTVVSKINLSTTTTVVSPTTDAIVSTKGKMSSQISTTAPATSPAKATTVSDTSSSNAPTSAQTQTTAKPVKTAITTITTAAVTPVITSTTTKVVTTPTTTVTNVQKKSSTPMPPSTSTPLTTTAIIRTKSTPKPSRATTKPTKATTQPTTATPKPTKATTKPTKRKTKLTTTIPTTTQITTPSTEKTPIITETTSQKTSTTTGSRTTNPTKPVTTDLRPFQTTPKLTKTSLKMTKPTRTMPQTSTDKSSSERSSIPTEQRTVTSNRATTSAKKQTTTTIGRSTSVAQNKTTQPSVSVSQVKTSKHPKDDTLKPLMIGLGVGIVAGLIIIGVIAYVCVRRRKFYTSRYEDELKPITNAGSSQSINNVQYYHDEEYEN